MRNKRILVLTLLILSAFFLNACTDTTPATESKESDLIGSESCSDTETLAPTESELSAVNAEDRAEIEGAVRSFFANLYEAWCQLSLPNFDEILDPESLAAHNMSESYRLKRDEFIFCVKYLSPYQFYQRWGFSLKQFHLKDQYEISFDTVTARDGNAVAVIQMQLKENESSYPFFISEGRNTVLLRNVDGRWLVTGRSADSINRPADDISEDISMRRDYENPDAIAEMWTRLAGLEPEPRDFDAGPALELIQADEPDPDEIPWESSSLIPTDESEGNGGAGLEYDDVKAVIQQYYQELYAAWCDNTLPDFDAFLDEESLFGNNTRETFKEHQDSKRIYAKYVPERYTEDDLVYRAYEVEFSDISIEADEAVVRVKLHQEPGLFPYFFHSTNVFCLSRKSGAWRIKDLDYPDWPDSLMDRAIRYTYVNPEGLKRRIFREYGITE